MSTCPRSWCASTARSTSTLRSRVPSAAAAPAGARGRTPRPLPRRRAATTKRARRKTRSRQTDRCCTPRGFVGYSRHVYNHRLANDETGSACSIYLRSFEVCQCQLMTPESAIPGCVRGSFFLIMRSRSGLLMHVDFGLLLEVDSASGLHVHVAMP